MRHCTLLCRLASAPQRCALPSPPLGGHTPRRMLPSPLLGAPDTCCSLLALPLPSPLTAPHPRLALPLRRLVMPTACRPLSCYLYVYICIYIYIYMLLSPSPDAAIAAAMHCCTLLLDAARPYEEERRDPFGELPSVPRCHPRCGPDPLLVSRDMVRCTISSFS